MSYALKPPANSRHRMNHESPTMPSVPPPPTPARGRALFESLSSFSERTELGAFATTIRLLFVASIVFGLLWLLK